MGNAVIKDFDWVSPDYDAVFAERRDRLLRLRGEPELLGGLYEHYGVNPVDFINDWGCTFDPRNPERGLPSLVPFLLFPRQVEFIEWLYARWRGGEDGLAEKSRDMGVSWLCVAFAVWMWVFHDGTVVGFGSRKEEYVDNLGDPKSLFWKVREFVKWLPGEFRPDGWSERSDSPYMRVLNRGNSSTIVGEAGKSIGRGNRTSIYFVDEAAFLEDQESVDAALSQTSNCKIWVSTPNGNGNAFYRKRMGGKVEVFTFNWRDDPRKGDDWYARQCAVLDPVVVAQEVDLNYEGSVENIWIDTDAVIAAQNRDVNTVEVDGPWMIGVDAAHEGNDKSIIQMRRGRYSSDPVEVSQASGVVLASRVVELCKDIESRGELLGQIVIELDGPGVSAYDQLRVGRYRRYVKGIHTGGRLKDDRNYNLRAKLWRLGNEYLQEGGCVLPSSPELKTQLCSVRYSYRDGLLLMQSKKEYKKMFNMSPDYADAWILTFYPFRPVRDGADGRVVFADAEYDEFA